MENPNEAGDPKAPQWVRSLAATLGHPQPQPGPPVAQAGTPRAAAVLVLLTDGPIGIQVLLTQRSSDLRTYPGKVVFPGGAQEPADADPVETALREAHEEVGLDPASVHILSSLRTVRDPQGKYIVTPVLAWSASPDFIGPVGATEVAEVHHLAIRELAAALRARQHPGQADPPGESAALANLLGEMTAGIVNTVADLLDRSTPKGSN